MCVRAIHCDAAGAGVEGALSVRAKPGVGRSADAARMSACATMDYSARTLWTNWTAIDPSPTAEATRFTLPARTSPTANTPGRLVSKRYGARRSGHAERK